jgi:hypothetical protein
VQQSDWAPCSGHERSSLNQFPSGQIEFYLEKLVAHEHGRRRLGQIAVLDLAIHGRDVNRLERQVALQQQISIKFGAKIRLNLIGFLQFFKNLVQFSFKFQSIGYRSIALDTLYNFAFGSVKI